MFYIKTDHVIGDIFNLVFLFREICRFFYTIKPSFPTSFFCLSNIPLSITTYFQVNSF